LGRILPVRTLEVYNFFSKRAKTTKLGDFPKIYLEKKWHGNSLSIKFDVTMATAFCQALFSEF